MSAAPLDNEPAYELPVPYATRVARYGRRLIFQNRNVIRLHERHPEFGPRPWPMEFAGREFPDEAGARRAVLPWHDAYFDSWEEAESWLGAGVFDG